MSESNNTQRPPLPNTIRTGLQLFAFNWIVFLLVVIVAGIYSPNEEMDTFNFILTFVFFFFLISYIAMNLWGLYRLLRGFPNWLIILVAIPASIYFAFAIEFIYAMVIGDFPDESNAEIGTFIVLPLLMMILNIIIIYRLINSEARCYYKMLREMLPEQKIAADPLLLIWNSLRGRK